MSKKTFKCVVAHPKFYMMVDGNLTHVEKGTTVEVTEKQFERAGTKLISQKEAKSLENGTLKSGGQTKAAMPEQIQAALTEAATKQAETEKALEAEKAKVKKLTDENKKLKADAKKASTSK